MDLTITVDDDQAADGEAINAGDLRELCERTISEKASQWAGIRSTESDRLLLEKAKAAPPALKRQIDDVVVKSKEPIIKDEPILG